MTQNYANYSNFIFHTIENHVKLLYEEIIEVKPSFFVIGGILNDENGDKYFGTINYTKIIFIESNLYRNKTTDFNCPHVIGRESKNKIKTKNLSFNVKDANKNVVNLSKWGILEKIKSHKTIYKYYSKWKNKNVTKSIYN